MKKLSQILAVGVITFIPLAVSSTAFAAGTCAVGFTGPDSDNQCVSTTTYACTVVNSTTVSVTNENLQIAVTGNASDTGNTTAGSSSSGSVTNSNGTTFSATVTNAPDTTGMGVCSVVATVPATAAIVTPTAAAVVVQAVPAPAGKGAAAALPDTSGDSTMAYLVGLVGVFGAGAVLSRLAVMAYSRLKS